MSSKKGRKKRGTTLALNDFLQSDLDSNSTGKAISITKPTDSWSDPDYEPRVEKIVVLPTAPSSVRGGAHVDMSRVPNTPPFKAFVGNISYEASEHALRNLFVNLSVVDVHLSKDSNGRFRGYGYIEFETRDDLVEALQMENLEMCGRTIRIDVKTQSDRDQQRPGGFNSFSRDDSKSEGDWRSMPRSTDTRSRYSNNYNSDNSSGAYRSPASFAEYSRDRDHDDRGPRGDDRGSRFGGGGFRQEDRGSRYGDRGFRQEDGPRRGGGYEDREISSDWRSAPRQERVVNTDEHRDRVDSVRASQDRSSDLQFPRTRTKLNLQPRTVPLDDKSSVGNSMPSSIFGEARPVDTSAREKEMEERLARTSLSAPSRGGATGEESRNSQNGVQRNRNEQNHNGSGAWESRANRPPSGAEKKVPDFAEASRFSALEEDAN